MSAYAGCTLIDKVERTSPLSGAAKEEARRGDQNDSPDGCRGQAVNEAATPQAQRRENPAAKQRSDQAQNHVGDASEASSARNLARQPSSNQTNENPADQRMRHRGSCQREWHDLPRGSLGANG